MYRTTSLYVCRILVFSEKIYVIILLNEVFMHLHVLAQIPASVIPAQLNRLEIGRRTHWPADENGEVRQSPMTMQFAATNPPAPSRYSTRSHGEPSMSNWIIQRRFHSAVLVAAALAVTSIFPGCQLCLYTSRVVDAFPTSLSHSAVRSSPFFSLSSTTTDADKETVGNRVKNEKGMRIAIVGSGAVGS